MGLLTLIGFGSYIAVSFIVGLRLLRLAQRTREIPELAMGGSLFGGSLGYCFYILATAPNLLPDDLRQAIYFAGVLFLDVGVGLLLLGVWRIFRPGARWAAAAFSGGSAALLVHFGVVLLSYDPMRATLSATFWLFNAVAVPCYAWSTFECFRYHGLLRKRERLGLAEPEMVHRLLLWGCAGGAALLMTLITIASRIVIGRNVDPSALAAQSLIGLVCSVSLWLSFLPPAAYLRAVIRAKAPA